VGEHLERFDRLLFFFLREAFFTTLFVDDAAIDSTGTMVVNENIMAIITQRRDRPGILSIGMSPDCCE